MKYLWVLISVVVMAALLVFGTTYKEVDTSYLRIHIRANSNLEVDQIVKYEIKDAVTTALVPYVANCNSFNEVKNVLQQNFDLINNVANGVLKKNGLGYTAKSRLATEEFPSRSYNSFVLEQGIYDALIIDLGNAKGDNWWCVIYPPLCFTSATSGSNVIYKSRIIEMIKGFVNN